MSWHPIYSFDEFTYEELIFNWRVSPHLDSRKETLIVKLMEAGKKNLSWRLPSCRRTRFASGSGPPSTSAGWSRCRRWSRGRRRRPDPSSSPPAWTERAGETDLRDPGTGIVASSRAQGLGRRPARPCRASRSCPWRRWSGCWCWRAGRCSRSSRRGPSWASCTSSSSGVSRRTGPETSACSRWSDLCRKRKLPELKTFLMPEWQTLDLPFFFSD